MSRRRRTLTPTQVAWLRQDLEREAEALQNAANHLSELTNTQITKGRRHFTEVGAMNSIAAELLRIAARLTPEQPEDKEVPHG